MPKWFDDPEAVNDFGKILHNAQLLTAEKQVDYYQNPQSYDTIHSLWIEYGMPTRDNPLMGAWKDWIEESFEVAA